MYPKQLNVAWQFFTVLVIPALLMSSSVANADNPDNAGNAVNTNNTNGSAQVRAVASISPTTGSMQLVKPADSYLKLFGHNKCVLPPLSSYAQIYYVTSNAELTRAYTNAVPGSAIVWRDGAYANAGAAQLDGAGGRYKAPITIRPETVNGVTFTGTFTQTYRNDYTHFVGFKFKDVQTVGPWLVRVDGDYSKINCNQIHNLSRGHGFALHGHDGEVFNNLFDGWTSLAMYQPSNSSELSGITPRLRNRYHHNTFRNSTGAGTPMMIGYAFYMRNGATSSEDESGAIIEWNLFDGPQADPETLSIKSGANIIRYNYFRNGRSENHLSIRLGHNNIAYGNLFQLVEPGYVTRVSGHNYKFFYNVVVSNNPVNTVTLAFLHGDRQLKTSAKYYAGYRGQYRRNVLVNVSSYAQVRSTLTRVDAARRDLAPTDNIFTENVWAGRAKPVYRDSSGVAPENWFLENNRVGLGSQLLPVKNLQFQGRVEKIEDIHRRLRQTISVTNSVWGEVVINPLQIPWLRDIVFR